MLYATIECKNGKCREHYSVGLYGDEGFAPCPVCSQQNTVPDQLSHITGRCAIQKCQRPIDDHQKGKCP